MTRALIIMVKGNSAVVSPNRRIAPEGVREVYIFPLRLYCRSHFTPFFPIRVSIPLTLCSLLQFLFKCHSTCKPIWVSQVKHKKRNNNQYPFPEVLLSTLFSKSFYTISTFSLSIQYSTGILLSQPPFCGCYVLTLPEDLLPPLALDCSWYLLPLAIPSLLASFHQTGQFAENKFISWTMLYK